MEGFSHIPVMLYETVDALNVKEGGLYVDCTLGGGGHTEEILKRGGNVIGIDRDTDAINATTKRLLPYGEKFRAVHGNFHDIKAILNDLGVDRIDGVLADLGVSSHQLDVRERGFSYHDDAPLDMRMDRTQSLTAADIVNTYPPEKIERIFLDFGEENWARQIVRVLTDERKIKPIETTSQLVLIVDKAIPKKVREKDSSHPARRIFQALRIAVNDELEPLTDAVNDMVSLLNSGGRIAIIAFHSLEDRIVKNAFKTLKDPCVCPKAFPVCVCGKTPQIKILTGKPIKASAEEEKNNPRSRSATLRAAEKL